jgi:glucose/arabinose dehydrogenase
MHSVLRFAVLAFACGLSAQVHAALPLETIKLPPGFKIELVTDQVPSAREMSLGPYENGRGTLFVGSMKAGDVYAITLDQGHASDVKVIASGLKLPVGVAYRKGSLYVSAVSQILRYDHVDGDLGKLQPVTVVSDRFPTETHHGWKYIAFGPDGDLYVPVGAPCNVCERDESRYYNIQKIHVDGSGQTVVAKGVRNTVGFDWNPADGSLWFSENGRDLLGDDMPSDELNHVPAKTTTPPHFGFPYCHQGDTPDPEFGKEKPCSQFTAPAALLGAHVASLGMRFYKPAANVAEAYPAIYRDGIFIAEHGSWNRSKKSGYRVVHVTIDGAKAVKQEVFAEGWLRGDETAWGRPADVLPLPDGSLLVSDDQAGAIYRIRYTAH